MKILIIEDLQMMREVLAKLCEQQFPSASIVAAETIKEAKDTLTGGFAPDFVISDGELPDGLGPSLFPLIREKNPRVFILLSSGKKQETFPDAEMDEFIQKPVRMENLVPIIEEVKKRLASS